MWQASEVVFDDNMCRLCGCSSDRLYNIDAQHITETILSMIKRLVPIIIESKDKKPQQVCYGCLSKLDDFNAFISLCLSTDASFTNILHNLKSIPQGTKSIFMDGSRDNMKSLETDDRVKLTGNSNVLVVTRAADNTGAPSQDVYFMLELNYKGINMDPVLIKCDENNTNPTELVKGVLPIGSAEVVQDKVNEEMTLSAPCKKKDKTKQFTCNICNKTLMRKRTLAAHVAIHSSDRPYKCPDCKKTFLTSSDQKSHMHIHSGMFTCQQCKKTFVTKSKLERHKKSHSGIKDHPCPICNRTFSEKNNMVAHMTIHTGERPFACTLCKKTFRTRSHFKDHKRSHSSLAPFKCDICGKCFKWTSNLKDHTKFHNGEKFKCNHCQKDFITRSDFNKHKKECKKTTGKICNICNAYCFNIETYQNHLVTNHNLAYDSELTF